MKSCRYPEKMGMREKKKKKKTLQICKHSMVLTPKEEEKEMKK